jgi:site-specific recombinase XerD
MTFVKSRKTKKGLTYHLIDVIDGSEVSKKLLVRSLGEARQYLYKYQGDKADNRPNSLLMKKTNFHEFVEKKFLPISNTRKTSKTIKADVNHMKPLLAKWGKCNLTDINSESIELFIAENLKNGSSKKTVNNRISILSSILRTAYRCNVLVRMPEIKFLKLDVLPPKGLSDEEVELILDSAKNREDKAMYDYLLVFLHTGFRASELQYLKWDDVDLRTKQLMVNKSKSHRFRVVPINEVLEKHLIALRGKAIQGQIYVFEHNGQPYTIPMFYNKFKRMLCSLGIEGSIHALRHTFASRLVQRGVSLYHVQKLLGHSTIKTTERYSHLRPVDLENAVKVLENDGTVTEPSRILRLKTA